MAKKVKIWTLNQASTLLRGKRHAIVDLFAEKNVTCVFGDRTPYNRSDGNATERAIVRAAKEESWNLMFEKDERYDEYFTPIPVKCLGSLFDERAGDLDSIREKYANIGMEHYARFWDPGVAPENFPGFPTLRMLTRPSVGYYQILEEAAENGEYENILIGYSQGGLVARYLAYLDEHVFAGRAVHAVITVAAPNYGSPLANPDNRDAIVGGVTRILRPLLHQLTTLPNWRMQALRHSPLLTRTNLTFEEFFLAYDEFIRRAGVESLRSILLSLRKWMAGLRDVPNNAFRDLSIHRLSDPHTVLHAVNMYPLQRIPIGTIGTAQDNPKVLADGLPGWLESVLSISMRGFDNEQIRTVFSKQVMREQKPETLSDAARERVRYYETGLAPGLPRINEFRHDFVIPTAYQLVAADPPFHPRWNPEGDHNSGRLDHLPGGRNNCNRVLEFLAAIRDRL